MKADTDELCADMATTSSGLLFLARAELVGMADMEPMSAGLRDILCAMIDRSAELSNALILEVERLERAARDEASLNNLNAYKTRQAAALGITPA